MHRYSWFLAPIKNHDRYRPMEPLLPPKPENISVLRQHLQSAAPTYIFVGFPIILFYLSLSLSLSLCLSLPISIYIYISIYLYLSIYLSVFPLSFSLTLAHSQKRLLHHISKPPVPQPTLPSVHAGPTMAMRLPLASSRSKAHRAWGSQVIKGLK